MLLPCRVAMLGNAARRVMRIVKPLRLVYRSDVRRVATLARPSGPIAGRIGPASIRYGSGLKPRRNRSGPLRDETIRLRTAWRQDQALHQDHLQAAPVRVAPGPVPPRPTAASGRPLRPVAAKVRLARAPVPRVAVPRAGVARVRPKSAASRRGPGNRQLRVAAPPSRSSWMWNRRPCAAPPPDRPASRRTPSPRRSHRTASAPMPPGKPGCSPARARNRDRSRKQSRLPLLRFLLPQRRLPRPPRLPACRQVHPRRHRRPRPGAGRARARSTCSPPASSARCWRWP